MRTFSHLSIILWTVFTGQAALAPGYLCVYLKQELTITVKYALHFYVCGELLASL